MMTASLTSDESFVLMTLHDHGHAGYQELKKDLGNNADRILAVIDRLLAMKLIETMRVGYDTHYRATA